MKDRIKLRKSKHICSSGTHSCGAPLISLMSLIKKITLRLQNQPTDGVSGTVLSDHHTIQTRQWIVIYQILPTGEWPARCQQHQSPISQQNFRHKKTPPIARFKIISYLLSNFLQLSSRFCKKYISLRVDYSLRHQIAMFGIVNRYNKDT